MTLERIRVIGIAVKSLADSRRFYEDILGLEPVWSESFPEPPVQARVVKYLIGDLALNLMESTEDGSPVDRFIQRRGEGLFSLVARLSPGGIEELRERGLRLAYPDPYVMEDVDFGAGETYSEAKMVWNDPKQGGVLFELQELR